MPMPADLKRVDVAYALLYNEETERVLVVQNENGMWTFPGGEVEPGETLQEAVVREAQEETGLEVAVQDLFSVSEKAIGDHHALFFVFYATIVTDQPINPHDADILQTKWVDLEEAERLMPWYEKKLSNLLNKSKAIYLLQ